MAQNDKKPFGARDMKIFSRTAATPTYGTGVDVGCFVKLEWEPQVTEKLLEGDDVICAVASQFEGIEVNVEHGGFPLPVYALMIGHTLTDSGTTPNEATIMNLKVNDVRPYFGFIATAFGTEGGPVMIIGYKHKLTDGAGSALEKGEFMMGEHTWVGIPSDYDSVTVLRAINMEWQLAISTTWLSNNVHI